MLCRDFAKPQLRPREPSRCLLKLRKFQKYSLHGVLLYAGHCEKFVPEIAELVANIVEKGWLADCFVATDVWGAVWGLLVLVDERPHPTVD